MVNDPKVIYIAGYGRSGSTILDIALSNHPDISGVGEAAYLFAEWDISGRRCTCGRPFRECPVFSSTIETPGEAAHHAEIARSVERRSRALLTLTGLRSENTATRYSRTQRYLFRSLTQALRTTRIVDSSKTARLTALRPWALSKIAGLDVVVVHLVRHAGSTLGSLSQVGSNWAREGHPRAKRRSPASLALGWVLANLAAALVPKLTGIPYVRIRYEDLVRYPEETLRRLEPLIGVSMEPLIERLKSGAPLEVGHRAGGNRMREAERVQFRTRSDVRPPQLPIRYQAAYAFWCAWLNRLYGY